MSIVAGNDWSSHHPLCQGGCFFGICHGMPNPLDCLRTHIVQSLRSRLARRRPTDPPPRPSSPTIPDDPLASPLTPLIDPPISPANRAADLAEFLQSIEDARIGLHIVIHEHTWLGAKARQAERDAAREAERQEAQRRPRGADAARGDDEERDAEEGGEEASGTASSQERAIDARIARFITRTVDDGLWGIRRAWRVILRILERLPEEVQERLVSLRHIAEYYLARVGRYLNEIEVRQRPAC
jgi:hypothetical protein